MFTVATRRPVLSVRRLRVHYPLKRGRVWPLFGPSGVIKAVDDMHFDLHAGETLGIVGESGCGKSTLARALVGLETPTGGQISIDGHNVTGYSDADWRPLRREVQIVFQDPLASLNPRMSIAQCIAEPLKTLCPEVGANERSARVLEMMQRVGLDAELKDRYPHEISGGQCQRVGIARALVVRPKVLICDEPVSALDVSVQAQIVHLLVDLQREYGLAMLFISHDLAVVRQLSHRVMVMYLGKVMEQSARDALFEAPQHPYTRALLSAVPDFEALLPGERVELIGEMPSPSNPPSGRVFRTRCPLVDHVCAQQVPVLRRVPSGGYSACHFAAYAESPMIPRTA